MTHEIKIITVSEDGFKKLDSYRKRLPKRMANCVDSIETGLGGIHLNMKNPYGGTVCVPSDPLKIDVGDNILRITYNGRYVVIPLTDKIPQMIFAPDQEA